MPAGNPITPVAVLRQRAAMRAEATSVSQVAREVGLTARGLQKFLDGSVPYSATRQKLERWYVREALRSESETDAVTASVALQLLMQDLPPAHRATVLQQAIGWWENVYAAAGLLPPRWLAELKKEEV